MASQPSAQRAVAFIDGQNLYHAAREAFGDSYPNYDPKKLAETVYSARGWSLRQVRLYTGIPEESDRAFWHRFWSRKLLGMSREANRAATSPEYFDILSRRICLAESAATSPRSAVCCTRRVVVPFGGRAYIQ